jgi:hypothetical protein
LDAELIRTMTRSSDAAQNTGRRPSPERRKTGPGPARDESGARVDAAAGNGKAGRSMSAAAGDDAAKADDDLAFGTGSRGGADASSPEPDADRAADDSDSRRADADAAGAPRTDADEAGAPRTDADAAGAPRTDADAAGAPRTDADAAGAPRTDADRSGVPSAEDAGTDADRSEADDVRSGSARSAGGPSDGAGPGPAGGARADGGSSPAQARPGGRAEPPMGPRNRQPLPGPPPAARMPGPPMMGPPRFAPPPPRRRLSGGQRSKLVGLAVLLVGLGLALGYLVAAVLPTQYAARTTIQYHIAGENTGDFLKTDRNLTTQVVLLTSRNVLGPVAEATGIPVDDLARKTSASIVDASDIIQLEVRDPNRDTGVQLANAIARQYLTVANNSGPEGYLRDQLAKVKQQQATTTGDAASLAARSAALQSQLDAMNLTQNQSSVLTPAYSVPAPFPNRGLSALTGAVCGLVIALLAVVTLARRWSRG